MKKILWLGDGVTPTGFSTVNHNIIKNLPIEEYDVHHLAINYFGDPHEFTHKVYPASKPQHLQLGDVWGYNRLPEMLHTLKPDLVYILNDIWVIQKYIHIIKEFYEKKEESPPKIIIYFPVDGSGYPKHWFDDFEIVSRICLYTQFGYDEVAKVIPEFSSRMVIIPHGTDTETFYKFEDKQEARKKSYPKVKNLWKDDAFIVLNANRNQPRKRLDISVLGFALFALDKPESVRYYHHAGVKDAGWNIVDLVRNIDIELKAQGKNSNVEDRLILTSLEQGVQKVSLDNLNSIYNSTHVGINTSLGEGWGLTATEHAATGVPQVVPDHTACAELFGDCGLLIPVVQYVKDRQTILNRGFVSAEGLAEQLEKLYTDEEFYAEKAEACYKKFTSPYYKWENITKTWTNLFEEVLNE